MANCFRGVSNKLYRTSYLKAANLVHSENLFASRKSTQRPSIKWNCLLTENKNIVQGCKSLYATHPYCKGSSRFPCNMENISSSYLPIEDRQKSPIDLLQSNATVRKPAYAWSTGLGSDENVSKKSESESSAQGRPSEEQLEHIFKMLNVHLPRIFVTSLPAEDYHPKIILENNFRNKRTVGLQKYVYELALVKLLVHWKFAYVRLQILKITKHPEDGTIKVRWRVVGVPGMSVILQFWKFMPHKLQKNCDEAPTWIDGFSIYYVGNDGKIIKHILDKMQPDDDRISANPKSTIAPKIAMFLGLLNEHEEAAAMCTVNSHKKDGLYISRVTPLFSAKRIEY